MSNTEFTGDEEHARPGTGADRRLLPRASLGRRAADEAKTGVIGAHHPDEKLHAPHTIRFFLMLVSCLVVGLAAIAYVNARFAPLLFSPAAIGEVAESLAAGKNYATFDLNINSRILRRTHIAALDQTPDVVVLGASHWQEAHAGLIPEEYFYNAHVHRDYFEDILSVTEMLIENNRLPKTMIITIRDNLFTPVEYRTDFLWVPTIPSYRAMARRLDLPLRPITEIIPLPQVREAISLEVLRANIERWLTAPELPHVTTETENETLDLLLSDGSIVWSREHRALFTSEFSRQRALGFAAQRRNDPPRIDPSGVAAITRLLEYLDEREVTVYLAHPPFNPIYFDALAGSAYMRGLAEVVAVTKRLSDRFGLPIIGSFDPADVGCRSSMYIDAEHSNAECLQLVLNGYREIAFAQSNPYRAE